MDLSNYKVNFNDLAIATSSKNWDCFFTEMKKTRVWAEGPVAQVTAWLLQRNIVVFSEGSNESNAYLFITGDELHVFPPIILGNTAGCHYQSYIPLKNFNLADFFKPPVFVSSTPEHETKENQHKDDSIASKPLPEKHSDFKDWLPLHSLINMVTEMKERHISIINDLDLFRDEFTRLHQLIDNLSSNRDTKQCVPVLYSESVEKENIQPLLEREVKDIQNESIQELLEDNELIQSFNEDMDIL